MKLKTIIKEDEGSIRDLMARFVNANKKDSKRAHDKWMSMILTRLIDLGFVSKIRKQIMYALDDVVNQKQFDTIVAQYKLFGDYADSFSPTEATLANALREAENEDQEDIESDVGGVKKNFKLILEIPFTTTENKDQKIRRLKYDLGINNIGIEDIQPVNVAELGQGVIDFQAVVYISTELTRSELTSALEPDYKISKMQRLDQESAQDANT